MDASGVTTSKFERWYDAKDGREMTQHTWIKAPLLCGVRTHIVTSVEITGGTAHESPHLPRLVEATAERFHMAEVSADKGYIGRRNLAAIAGVGAVPYIPFKANDTDKGPELWRRL